MMRKSRHVMSSKSRCVMSKKRYHRHMMSKTICNMINLMSTKGIVGYALCMYVYMFVCVCVCMCVCICVFMRVCVRV